jgi:hypothetical protein
MAKTPNRTSYINYPAPRGRVLAIYIWDNSTIKDPATLLNNCSKVHINTLYIQWGGVAVTNTDWQTFIAQAHSRGFKVWALDGANEWGLTANVSQGMTTINEVTAYNNVSTATQKFDGVHYDVETYNDSSNLWTTNNSDCQYQWYTSMKAYHDAVHQAGMFFGGALPHWLDNGFVGDTQTTIVSQTPPQFFTKELYKMFIDLFDQYAVMSYSMYTATQENDITAELTYADTPKVIVGFETTNVDPATITYYGQPLNNVLSAVHTVDNDLISNNSYLGCFLHDYNQLVSLLATNPNVAKASKRTLSVSRINQPNR